MISSAIMATLHHIAAFGLFACLMFEHLALKTNLTVAEAKRLVRIDRIYGIFAIIVVAIGLLRVMAFEKGLDYYLKNPFFHAKVTFFIIAAAASVYPTVRFLSWRKDLAQGIAPTLSEKDTKRMLMCMRVGLLALIIVIACAAFMARGVGFKA